MKNKLILSLLAALVFGAHSESSAQSLGQCTFVDVATLGDGVGVATSTGIRKVNATVLTKNQRWTRDKVYVLAQNVIIPDGITVVIEPGTLIRAERNSLAQGTGSEAPVTPADPGAIVVARGGKLIAIGTADAPIIFTSIDDINVPGGASTVPPFENKGVVANGSTILNGERALRTFTTPAVSGTPGVGEYTITGGSLNTAVAKGYSTTWAGSADSAFKHDGLWGGIVLCGKSTVMKNHADLENGRTTSISIPVLNVETGGIASGTQRGIQFVEGMAGFPIYSYGGGDEENDDSGALRFVSNRYGGYTIASDAELNSFSFYGVGRNTVLEFLEAINNADDDFEFWGGDVNLKYGISAFCGDDGLDTDQGFLGVVQYFIQLQNNSIGTDGVTASGRSTSNYGDSAGEHDGPESSNTSVPYSTFTLANATIIGRGYGAASYSGGPFAGPNFKDNAGCRTYNSLIMDNPHGCVLIMDRVTSVSDNSFGTTGNSSINRFAGTRTSGGFDGAGRASDLVTGDTGTADGPDGLYNNTWFFRNGYADSTAVGVNGVYASKALFDAAVSSLPATSAANRFPDSTDREGRGGQKLHTTTYRANTAAVQAEITKAANYNVFDQNPGVVVSPYHRLGGMDLRVTLASARDLSNSSLPSYRGLNSDASFVGAVRDNMWMRGWTLGDQLGVYSGTQVVPEYVRVNVSGTNPLIEFQGVLGHKYVLEVSTDNKSYTKVTTITATAGNNPYTDTARTVGSNPLFYRVICL